MTNTLTDDIAACPGCLDCTPTSLLAGSIMDETPRCGGHRGDVSALPQRSGEAVHRECEEAAREIAALRRELAELNEVSLSEADDHSIPDDELDRRIDKRVTRRVEIAQRLRELESQR